MADLLDRPIMLATETQMCAKGAAMFAAVAAGFFKDLPHAQETFCEPYRANYFPNKENGARYEKLYQKYCKLGQFLENY